MSTASKPPANSYLPAWLRGWEQFWFTPGDPTLLSLIRIGCGLIVVYTLIAHGFKLQEHMGEYGWHDLKSRLESVNDSPVQHLPLDWNIAGTLPAPQTEFQVRYFGEYRRKFGYPPPPPYPLNEKEAEYLDYFRYKHGYDLRLNGLKPPTNDFERAYAENYATYMRQPPPAYPGQDLDPNDPMRVQKIREESDRIQEYVKRWRVDPRRVYAKGTPVFSLWFHVTDPTAMAVVHGVIILIACLFTIGFCTRITSALIWFASLSYIHRNPTMLFGVDTMMTIVLFYLMIGPSGGAYSVDRLIRKWWVTAKPGVVKWWYGLLRKPVPGHIAPADPVPETPTPSISANVALRLLQVHVCIVYLYAGLSKLQGPKWWDGGAIWLTMGNFEFAPMQFEFYLSFLRLLGRHQLLYDAFMTGGGLFTLVFEIGYAFLIWRPKMRWLFLGAAIMLHGGIGLFMGLKTFSLMMLVMNMAFLRKEEAVWIFTTPFTFFRSSPAKPAAQPAAATAK